MNRKFYAEKSERCDLKQNIKVASNENLLTKTFSIPVVNYFTLAIFSTNSGLLRKRA